MIARIDFDDDPTRCPHCEGAGCECCHQDQDGNPTGRSDGLVELIAVVCYLLDLGNDRREVLRLTKQTLDGCGLKRRAS